MAKEKLKNLFVCSHCDTQVLKWQGRCPECGSWGTLQEQMRTAALTKSAVQAPSGAVVSLENVPVDKKERFTSGLPEFDRVMGGGFVVGSLTLLGGDPGIGKSTLIMQIAGNVAASGVPVLYVSGEESAGQVKMRLDRLNLPSQNVSFLAEENIDVVVATLLEHKPQLAIIDSIQTVAAADVSSEAGSVNQIRACTVKLLEVAKKHHIAVVIIGHVTKEGVLGGPKTLEHLVDTVVYMESDPQHVYRIVRTAKNRFGPTSEVGVFDMRSSGLAEVKNPAALWLSQDNTSAPGTTFSSLSEGSRTFLVEVQSLLSKTVFGYPLRKAVGFDLNRLHLLLAVLVNRLKLPLGTYDIHINVVGGFRGSEPSLDLAVCASILSALHGISLPRDLLVLGEVGLSGEVRSVPQLDTRIQEAKRQGFQKYILPSRGTLAAKDVEVFSVKNVRELAPMIRKLGQEEK